MSSIKILIILLFPIGLFSQTILKLDEAVALALENNFDIQVSQLELLSDEMQVYKSNAGFGPVVDWNVNYSMTGNNVNQKFVDGRVVNRFGRAFNPSTSVNLGLTLLDGGRRQATYDRLGKLSEFTDLQGKVIIQNTIVDVMESYFDIVRQKETVQYLETIIKYYEERVTITEQRWEVGRGSKIDFLQSKTDLNVQRSELARAKNNLKNAKVLLNGVINRDPAIEFDTEQLANADRLYSLKELTDQARENNRDVLLLQKSLEISQIQEKVVAAGRAPQLGLTGNVGFAYSNTNAGFLLSNQNLGITAGVGMRWNIYDGNHIKNQIAIAKINSEIIEKQQEGLEAQIFNDLSFAFNQYESDKELLTYEEENKSIAEENLSISIEKFRLGGSTILELSEAQRAYDTALNRLVNAQYNQKISELNLLRLSGTLVQ